MGRPLMPWQRQVSDVALEVDDDGFYVYSLVIVSTPRQAGKTVNFSAVGQHRAWTVPRGRVWFTMQHGQDARDWFLEEHLPLVEPFHRAGRLFVRRSNGSEGTRWAHSGGTFRPFSPGPDCLHSKATDLVIIDECWSFDRVRGRQLDVAIQPTQATRRGAQVWKVSTAGDDSSTWWDGLVAQGRAAVGEGRREGIAYFEWSCPDDLDPCDPASWLLFHPAYGRTITHEAMVKALDLLGPDEFARAYGNRPAHTAARVIPAGCLVAAADEGQELPAPGGLALGFDVAVDRSDATIFAAWRDAAGVAHVEVADHQGGAAWVAGRLAELVGRWRPRAVGYDKAGPALDVADQAQRAGVELLGLGSKEYQAACAGFLDAICADPPGLRFRPHPAFDDAAAVASRRHLGDAWAWGRRQSAISISPLTAATVALWAFDHARAGPGRFVVL